MTSDKFVVVLVYVIDVLLTSKEPDLTYQSFGDERDKPEVMVANPPVVVNTWEDTMEVGARLVPETGLIRILLISVYVCCTVVTLPFKRP